MNPRKGTRPRPLQHPEKQEQDQEKKNILHPVHPHYSASYCSFLSPSLPPAPHHHHFVQNKREHESIQERRRRGGSILPSPSQPQQTLETEKETNPDNSSAPSGSSSSSLSCSIFSSLFFLFLFSSFRSSFKSFCSSFFSISSRSNFFSSSSCLLPSSGSFCEDRIQVQSSMICVNNNINNNCNQRPLQIEPCYPCNKRRRRRQVTGRIIIINTEWTMMMVIMLIAFNFLVSSCSCYLHPRVAGDPHSIPHQSSHTHGHNNEHKHHQTRRESSGDQRHQTRLPHAEFEGDRIIEPFPNPSPLQWSRTAQQPYDQLTVETNSGLVRGVTLSTPLGKQVDAFLGIPFAKPPVGKYRFRHPKPVDKWEGIFNASTFSNSCYQVNDTYFGSDFRGSNMWNANTPLSEDCLKLNLWIPRPRPKNCPVLVWIFGGGFYYGTTSLSLYDGRILASEEDIIVASVNYRVASLGFLFADRTEAPGNAGMFDQIMGLEWIRDNIANFGGNPANVTLFGESAGAVSIAFHLLSPLSRNLFNQAIMQSGGATCPWGITDRRVALHRTILLARNVGCPSDPGDMEPVVTCLQKVDPWSLIMNETGASGVVDFPFTPIVDGSFLDELPAESLKSGNFKRAKLLMGSDKDEGNFFIIYHLTDLYKKSEEVYISREDFGKIVSDLNPNFPPIGHAAIAYEYTNWLDPDDAIYNRDSVDKMVGDYHFTCHVNEMAQVYATSGQDVFMYYFVHRSSYSPWPKWMGVLHGDEINFIFGEPLDKSLGYTTAEVDLSRRMMKHWANFAKTGDPARSRSDQYTLDYWPLHTASGKEYMILSTNGTGETSKGIRARQCAFWNKYLPQLLKDVSEGPSSCSKWKDSSDFSLSAGVQVTLILLLIIIVVVLLLMTFYAFRWREAAAAVRTTAAT